MEEMQGQILHGHVLTDSDKKEWIIGSLIRTGDSVEYYGAAEHKEKTLSDYPAFIKVKPNGDVSFTSEIHFYKQHTNSAKIERWMKSKEIQHDNLCIPRYLGSALNVQVQNIPFDFLVLERYDLDLQTLLSQHHNLFPKPTVLKLSYHIVRGLEYLHSRGIVHGDIRACNIRMDLYDESIPYLLPQFNTTDESDRNAVMFWSTDKHCGAATKRGDFESLLYNLIDWSGGILPWKDALPDEAKDMKIRAFENPKQFFQDAFPSCECEDSSVCSAARKCAASGKSVAPFKCLQAIEELMEQVAFMKKCKKRRPNYRTMEKIVRSRLLNMYHVPASKLEFSILTIIGDEDHEDKSSRSQRTSVGSYVPGLEISTEVLANIIAENCSSFDEANMFDRPGGVVCVVSKMKRINNPSAAKYAIQKAWEEDTQSLRTKVIKKWRLKKVRPGDYSAWKRKSTERQMAIKTAEKLALMKAKEKAVKLVDLESPDHESPVEVEQADERNRGTSTAQQDPNLNAASGHQLLQLTTQQSQKNGPDKSAQKEHSLSPSRSHGNSSSPSMLCQTLPESLPSPSKSNELQSPIFPVGNNGLDDPRSSQDESHSAMLSSKMHEKLLEEMDQNFQDARSSSPSTMNRVPSPVSPTVSNGLCNRRSSQADDSHSHMTSSRIPEQFNEKADQRLPGDTVFETREKAERTGEQVIEQQRSVLANAEQWHETYDWLDSWLRLREVLLKAFGQVSSNLDSTGVQVQQLQDLRVLREDYDKQDLLDRLSHLETVLTGLSPGSVDAPKLNRIQQRWLSQLAWLEETSRKLGDLNLNQVHEVLQDSEVLAWLVKELDGMSEKLTISTDPAKLQQQREFYQIFYHGVIKNEPKVVKLINEGQSVLKLQNLKSDRAQQLFLGVIQRQWNRLKKSCLDIHSNLQNVENYWQTQSSFLEWLSKTENKLRSLKPISLNNIGEVLKELSLSTNEACEKADEFAEIAKLGRIYVGVCDEDKDNKVKDEFNVVKDRWAKLNIDLLKRTQSLEAISELVVNFNKNLHCLQQKIELCEAGLASYNASGEAAEDSTLSDCSKALQKEVVLLQRLYDIVCQEAKNLLSKTREESIDASHLLNEMDRVTISVKSLNFNVSESTIKIFKQQCVVLTTELEQAKNYRNTILEIIEKKRTLTLNIERRLSNITDLEKIVQIVEGLGFPINVAAMRQQVELLSQEIHGLGTHENRLQELLNNGKHSSNVDERMEKAKEQPSEEKRDAISESESSNDDNCRNNKKTESYKRKTHSSISDSDSESKSKTSSNSSQAQIMSDSDLSPPRPKKSKHSKDINDYDSNLSLPRNDQSRQDAYSCHSETEYDSDVSSPTSSRQSSKRSRASSLASKRSDTQPNLFRPYSAIRYLRGSLSSNQKSNSPVVWKFDTEGILRELDIKREIKKEPCEINESFHGEESCLMPRAINLEPGEIDDSNVKEFSRSLPAIKAEPMPP